MLPNFLIAGAQKCGTTSMWSVLRGHAQVFMSDEKEINFFGSTKRHSLGMEWYRQHFAGVKNETAVGEATPTYLYKSWAPRAIRDALPDVKLIFCLRNPIDRAYSQYWHDRRRLWCRVSFEEATRDVNSKYIVHGLYHRHLSRFYDRFPSERILVAVYETLLHTPERFYAELCRFIGVSENIDASLVRRRLNQSEVVANPVYRFFLKHPEFTFLLPKRGRGVLMRLGPGRRFRYPEMREETRQRLYDLFAKENERLSELAGISMARWNRSKSAVA